ncbi:MAG TPA: flagellar biosynthetic protein FliQ [Stellaceae bacterium]|jgi:flagellar biosynthesis protein FliQ|nr:flagellar biosynthetic protein FliQ [Stellaceae bacterium]
MGGVSQATHGALLTIFFVAGPVLGVILVIGLTVSVFLAVTQLNEPTLSFVPKFFGTALALLLLGPWLLRQLESFAVAVFTGLPGMLS